MSDPNPVPPVNPVPWWAPYALAAFVLTGFDVMSYLSFLSGDKTLFTTMATGALTLTGVAIGYFYQSSAGSAKKDDTLALNAANPVVPSPPPGG